MPSSLSDTNWPRRFYSIHHISFHRVVANAQQQILYETCPQYIDQQVHDQLQQLMTVVPSIDQAYTG